MILNRYKLLSILCLCMVFMESCIKKPLEQKPTGSYTTATFWRNQNDVIANVLGIYNILYIEDWIGHAIYTYDDQSDDIYVAGDHPDFKAVGNLNADASLQVIYYNWPFAYLYTQSACNGCCNPKQIIRGSLFFKGSCVFCTKPDIWRSAANPGKQRA